MTTTETAAAPRRYHIKVTVPGNVIALHHFADLGAAQDYPDDVARQNLYGTDLAVCTDPDCVDDELFDKPAGYTIGEQ